LVAVAVVVVAATPVLAHAKEGNWNDAVRDDLLALISLYVFLLWAG
jgi:hypothetical protein